MTLLFIFLCTMGVLNANIRTPSLYEKHTQSVFCSLYMHAYFILARMVKTAQNQLKVVFFFFKFHILLHVLYL